MKRNNNQVIDLVATDKTSARLSAHSGSHLVTLDELRTYSTPEPTKTWRPVAHADIPDMIAKAILAAGWHFTGTDDPVRPEFQLSVTENGTKMFGITKIGIPGLLEGEEFGLALGFRNSHDKSIAFQLVIGTDVFVCDNMMFSGGFKVRREHTINISVSEVIEGTFREIPSATEKLGGWFGGLRQLPMGSDEGVSFLARAVEVKALPIGDFMNARSIFLGSFKSEERTQIQHGGTMWSVYQAITAQWKKHSPMQIPEYSRNLNALVLGKDLAADESIDQEIVLPAVQ